MAQKGECPPSQKIIKATTSLVNVDFRKIYINKIKNIQDPKISEFNYKVLHQILSCNYNLHRWGKHESGLCDLCNQTETITHLLFDCHHAQKYWHLVKRATNIAISRISILIGTDCNIENTVISTISYLIYKEWLVQKNENVRRCWETSIYSLCNELNYKIQIYNLTKNQKIKQILHNIKSEIRGIP